MKNADEILARYNAGTATPEEVELVESWYLKYKTPPSDLGHSDLVAAEELGLQRLRKAMNAKRTIRLWKPMVAAMLLVGLGWFGLYRHDLMSGKEGDAVGAHQEQWAVLTLSDGKKITLSADNVGKNLADESIQILQSAEGELVYKTATTTASNQPLRYNTIETPRGSQYKIVLPDGSVVYLSAQSRLRYPVAFAKDKRNVELEGQAHFDVVAMRDQNSRTPFVVEAGKQIVQVLGTQFNVCAYPDEDFIETALLEGKVKVAVKGGKNEVVLMPGQLARQEINTAILNVETVDIQDLQAWKEGYFIFNNENIKDIMRKLSRWYGLDVTYVGNMDNVSFQGNYLRTREVRPLLKTLELANDVYFEITEINNERRVVVKRK